MILSIFIQAITSLVIILVLHYLYIFFRQNLTTPKIQDLVNKPSEEYRKIYNTIKNEENTTSIETPNQEKMKDELKKYMKSLSSKKSNTIKLNVNNSGNNVNNVEFNGKNGAGDTASIHNVDTIRSFNDNDFQQNNDSNRNNNVNGGIESFSMADVSAYSAF